MNFAEEIFRHAIPGAEAVRSARGVVSYAQLDAQSADFAARLRATVSRRPGARIGLRAPDGADYVVMALGILRAGGCLVPLSTSLSPRECRQISDEIALDAMVGSGPAGVSVESIPAREFSPPWDEALRAMSPAFIRFSSGTTGNAKGIVLSHETLAARVQAANAGLAIGSADRILWVLPMSHHFAVSIMLYLRFGATIVLPASHLADDMLQAAKEAGATVLYAAPYHLELLANAANAQWPTLRLAVATTAPLSLPSAANFRSRFGVAPSQALGIIEVGLPCLNAADPAGRPESVGRPQPDFTLEVRRPSGGCAAVCEPGELWVRGPGLLDAYVSPWRARAQIVDSAGFFASGDIAEIDAAGFVTLRGRASTAISIGGMKFFPEEVEDVLTMHPAVAAARVSARSHPDFGMVPVAEVTTVAGCQPPPVTELMKLCRAELSRYKIPAEIRHVHEIPRTTSGKVKRA